MQQFIRNLSIGRKLILLLSLPVLLLLWLASSQLMNRLQEVQVAQQVGSLSTVPPAGGITATATLHRINCTAPASG